jgi:lipopolysaccharide export system permease protein
VQPSPYAPLPVLSRYLIRQFLGLFVAILAAFVTLYLVVDLFNRLDILLRNHASVDASLRYFLFKIPLIITQIAPAAVITAILLALGLLARHGEITALRASGVSLVQSAVPLIGVALLISLAVLIWNETVVPYCSREFQYVNKVEIRKRAVRGILSDREIWYHGKNGFYNIAHVDKEKRTIFGLVIYGLDDEFHLDHVIEVESAHWVNGAWQIEGAVEHRLSGSGDTMLTRPCNDLVIPETLGDFLEVRREPEELSFLLLRQWIDHLTHKGIDASNYLVELHLKLAVPFASLVLALVGIPISGRVTRHPSVALIVGLGGVVGFCYWVVLALSQSLGLSGALPPVVAAWSANVLFTLIGVAFFLYAE